MSYTAYGYVWAILSIVTCATLCACVVLPHWLVGELSLDAGVTALLNQDEQPVVIVTNDNEKSSKHSHAITYFGVFRRCNFPRMNEETGEIDIDFACARYRSFGDIPSVWWQVATVTLAFGTCLTALVAAVAIPSFFFKDVGTRTSIRLLGIAQLVAALCLLITALLYPLGFNARQVRESCSWRSEAYKLGSCQIGWAYYTLIACIALLGLCALLSIRSGKRVEWRKVLPPPSSQDGYSAYGSLTATMNGDHRPTRQLHV